MEGMPCWGEGAMLCELQEQVFQKFQRMLLEKNYKLQRITKSNRILGEAYIIVLFQSVIS